MKRKLDSNHFDQFFNDDFSLKDLTQPAKKKSKNSKKRKADYSDDSDCSDSDNSDSYSDSDSDIFQGVTFKDELVQQLYQKKGKDLEKVIKLPATSTGYYVIDIRLAPLNSLKKIPKSDHWKKVNQKLLYVAKNRDDEIFTKLKSLMKSAARKIKSNPKSESTASSIKKWKKS